MLGGRVQLATPILTSAAPTLITVLLMPTVAIRRGALIALAGMVIGVMVLYAPHGERVQRVRGLTSQVPLPKIERVRRAQGVPIPTVTIKRLVETGVRVALGNM
jgi:hypothetical protein